MAELDPFVHVRLLKKVCCTPFLPIIETAFEKLKRAAWICVFCSFTLDFAVTTTSKYFQCQPHKLHD
jgi:hypothetical protein